jgi:antitoxin (DNA-binding transcriptional repressor) of toxin-antitoxin stability system
MGLVSVGFSLAAVGFSLGRTAPSVYNCCEEECETMIQITVTDFKANLGKYLNLVRREEIRITQNGADIAVLIAPPPKPSWVDDLIGVIPDSGVDEKKIKSERLAEKYESLH